MVRKGGCTDALEGSTMVTVGKKEADAHEHDDLCKKSNCVNRYVLFLRRILRVVNKALVDFFCQK